MIDRAVNSKIEHLATKEELYSMKTDIMKAIYIAGLMQFLAIVASVLAIVTFMIK